LIDYDRLSKMSYLAQSTDDRPMYKFCHLLLTVRWNRAFLYLRRIL